MHAFLAGLAAGVLGGGALSYLYAQRVIKQAKQTAESLKAAAKAFDQPPHH